MSFVKERLIRFSDCDPAGIVFYPQYFVMFNGLMEDWISEGLGIGFKHLLQQRRIGLPTVHLEADFRAISRMGDCVRLSLNVARLGSRSITLDLIRVRPGLGRRSPARESRAASGRTKNDKRGGDGPVFANR